MKKILIQWDDEAKVFVATSEDIPGLVTESATPEELVKKLQNIVPELLELNAHLIKEEIKEVYLIFEEFESPIECAAASR